MNNKIIFLGILSISLLLCGCCCLAGGGNNDYITIAPTVTPTTSPADMSTYTPTPIPRSIPTGTYLVNKMDGVGVLTIDNGLNEDAVIILCKTDDPKNTLLSVYVQAESTYNATGIDDGDYYIYDMTGIDWDSSTNKFTRSLAYERFDDSFDFASYDWSIGLKPRVGGNADYSEVSAGNFPTT